MRAFLAKLYRERRGATIVEFAIISPVMILFMMGMGDLLYQMYAQSVLNGAVQKAARDSGIEGNATTASAAAIDGNVITIMTPLIKSLTQSCATNPAAATWCSTRRSYDSFSEAATPEPFTDTNHNGVRDAGECFTDENGNGTWDADPSTSGQGGASSVTIYTFTITYPRIFPVANLFGWSANQKIAATTLLKNQPYATQTVMNNVTVCT